MRTFVVLLVGCLLASCSAYSLPLQEVDIERATEITQIISERISYGDSGSLLDSYNKYGLADRSYIHCKDFAFAFVSLYGNEAQVAYNEDHAFVLIGSTVIEPNQNDFRLDYRLSGASYRPDHVVKIKTSDQNKILSSFM